MSSTKTVSGKAKKLKFLYNVLALCAPKKRGGISPSPLHYFLIYQLLGITLFDAVDWAPSPASFVAVTLKL